MTPTHIKSIRVGWVEMGKKSDEVRAKGKKENAGRNTRKWDVGRHLANELETSCNGNFS